MPIILKRNDQERSPGGTALFEGGEHGAPISLFLLDTESGKGPDLHRHPYPELWVIHEGTARFLVDEEEIIAEPGDVVMVEAGIWHGFKSSGNVRLKATCIHSNGRIVQEFKADIEG
ncbi:cupin domain-containing protein [Aliihoeflea aestuarii]|jgi:mannose-6-phosphate isomerase-like protein (cupin superfamily)|uniref:cupin domain-containing protein n=1 Tax=Aliihoeflea aestuarii TaxID=453840 RepID=UPI002095F6C6|nr:cupin domain-containing protein [Aliihoeflea aestuarii]MCO6392037.1 cupin domain-containing protein [Aliihoeflea aestuarii]